MYTQLAMFSLAIVQFHMLHSLDHNQITDKGAGMLAKALKVNQSHASGGIFFISFIEYRVAGKFGGGGGTHTHAYHTRVHKYQNITHTFSVFPDLQKSLSTIVMNLKRKGPTQRRSLTGVRQSRILLVTPWSVARSSLYIVLCTPFIHAVYPEIHMMPMWSALKIVIIVPCPVHCKICGLAS